MIFVILLYYLNHVVFEGPMTDLFRGACPDGKINVHIVQPLAPHGGRKKSRIWRPQLWTLLDAPLW